MAGGGEGGHYILRVPYSLEGCDGWDRGGEGGKYYFDHGVQWKDIRPWRPEFGPEGNHFVSGG